MKIQGQHYRTIWVKENDPHIIQTIDQRLLPFQFKIVDLKEPVDFKVAISDMIVRGAPLVGVTAAFGIYAATLSSNTGKERKNYILEAAAMLKKTIFFFRRYLSHRNSFNIAFSQLKYF